MPKVGWIDIFAKEVGRKKYLQKVGWKDIFAKEVGRKDIFAKEVGRKGACEKAEALSHRLMMTDMPNATTLPNELQTK